MKIALKSLIPPLVVCALIILSVWSFLGNMREVSGCGAARKTLVIDAGHGGIDSGALSVGGVRESDINLPIALATRDIANFFGVATVMTRTDDSYRTDAQSYSEHDDLVYRVDTANSTAGGVLLSIHQNTYPTGQPSGAQVIYAADALSEAWGRHTHNNLVQLLDPKNRRVAVPTNGKFLILDTAECPALLVECGFMSNFTEIERLLTPSYQVQLSAVLLASFLQFDFHAIHT